MDLLGKYLSHSKCSHSGSSFYMPAWCYGFTYSLEVQTFKSVFILACSLLEIIFKYCFIMWIWNPPLYIWEHSVLGLVISCRIGSGFELNISDTTFMTHLHLNSNRKSLCQEGYWNQILYQIFSFKYVIIKYFVHQSTFLLSFL